jgi:hypothetical protein
MLARRLFLIPRWAGKAGGDFYSELENAAQKCGFNLVTLVPPSGLNPPLLEECFAMLDRDLKDAKEEDVLIAHSVGNQIYLRWLARPQTTLSGGKQNHRCICWVVLFYLFFILFILNSEASSHLCCWVDYNRQKLAVN